MIGICVVVTVIMSIIGWIGNQSVHDGVDQFLTTMTDAATNQTSNADQLQTNLTVAYAIFLRFDFPAQTQLNITVTQLQESVTESYNSTANATSSGYEIETAREVLLDVSFISALIAALFGVLSIIFGKTKCTRALGIFSFITIGFCFTALAIHIPATVMLADLCVELDGTLSGTSNATGLFNLFIDCLPETTQNSLYAIQLSLNSVAKNPATTTLQRQLYNDTNVNSLLTYAADCGVVLDAYNTTSQVLCVTTISNVDLCVASLWLIGAIYFFLGFPAAFLAELRFRHHRKQKKAAHRQKQMTGTSEEMEEYGWQ